MTDKPTVTASLTELLAEVKPLEPYRLGTKHGVVEFPNPAELDAWEADALLEELRTAGSNVRALERLLPPEELEKIRKLHLSARQLEVVMQDVNRYYQAQLGTPGEGTASGA